MTSTLLVHIDALDRSGPAWRALDGAMGRAGGALRSLREGLRDWTIIGAGAIRILGSLKDSFAGLVGQAQQQANAEVRLAAALAQTTSNVRDQVQAMRDFADRRQQLTTFSDDVTLSLASLGASFGITGDTLMRTIEAVQDRAVAFGKDPEQLMMALGKFFQGTANDLGRLGIAVDESLPRTEAFARVIQQLRTGVAEAVGELPTSAFAKLGNQIDEVRESLGFLITATGTFKAVTDLAGSLASSLKEFLSDPENVRRFAETFDDLVRKVVMLGGSVAAGAVRGAAFIVEGIEAIGSAALKVGNTVSASFLEMRAGIMGLQITLMEALAGIELPLVGKLMSQKSTLGIGSLIQQQAGLLAAADNARNLSTNLDLGSKSMRLFAEAVEFGSGALAAQIPNAELYDEKLSAIINSFAKLQEQKGQKQQPMDPAALEAIQQAIEQAVALGSAYTDAFTRSVVDSFDREVGVREAFQRLGQDVRGIFISQMTGAALDPIKLSIGQLAQALAAPFRLVGQAINAVLSPLTTMISKAIAGIFQIETATTAAQGKAAAAAAAAIAGVTATAAALGTVWAVPAIAASIATLGTAAKTGGLAYVEALTAGKLATVAAMATPLAEGGLVMPRPGGVPAILAEAGEPELALPLSKAADFFRDAMGPARVEVHVQIDQVSLLPEDRDRALADLGREMERQAQAVLRALPGSRHRRTI